MNNEINIYTLHKKHDDRKNNREGYYKDILKKCWNKISMVSSMHQYVTECTFCIPEFVIGIPPHNMGECSNFIYNSLIASGFKVHRDNVKTFQISWDKKYIKDESKNIEINEKNSDVDNFRQLKSKPKPKTKKNSYKGIDEYKATGTLLYNNMWNKVEENNKLLFS